MMRPQIYDRYVIVLSLPALFVTFYFCLMIFSTTCFPYATGRRTHELFTPIINPMMVVSFLSSPMAVYYFGRSTTNRLMSGSFLFNGLYVLTWVVIGCLFFFAWAAKHPSQP